MICKGGGGQYCVNIIAVECAFRGEGEARPDDGIGVYRRDEEGQLCGSDVVE